MPKIVDFDDFWKIWSLRSFNGTKTNGKCRNKKLKWNILDDFQTMCCNISAKKSLKKAISSTILRLVFLQGFLSLLLWSKQVVKHSLHGWNIAPFHKGFQVFSLSTLRASIKAGKAMVGRYLHGVWKSEKKSHSTLRAKRVTFTFKVDKSSFGEFFLKPEA